MAKPASIPNTLERALDRVAKIPLSRDFYLAGGTAIGIHLAHRVSRDLDFFSTSPNVNLEDVKDACFSAFENVAVRAETDVALHLVCDEVPIDWVRYRYAPLETPQQRRGCAIAGLLDLSAMKLSALARRGIRRDFWDTFSIAQGGIPLAVQLDAYRTRFGRSEADTYHVIRALTYFADAEVEATLPMGMDEALWLEIKAFFLEEAPRQIL
jgi:hypothetical protein